MTGLVPFLWAAIAAEQEPRARVYLVVIAENDSLDAEVPALQYADDDGAKNFELFSLYADEASLFAVFDADTARLHPRAAERAEVPERSAILERLARYNEAMDRDVARGDVPELFLLYAGHGDVDDEGQGYVSLHDGRLTRHDLYAEVIGPSRARYVHVVIDACKSYFLVKSRGKAWKDDAAPPSSARVESFLADELLDRHPRAGVIVATSGDRDTHEWSRYRGGILSHELRSALSGAADVNGDRRVEYSEVRAFLAAANARVKNPEVRLETFSRPPAVDRNRPLVDLNRVPAGGDSHLIHFAEGMSGHFSIEDDRGVRYADVNKDGSTAFDVLVPSGRGYFVQRNGVEEAEIEPAAAHWIDLAAIPFSRVTLASRGSVDRTFRNDLYQVPFGRSFYDGFVATSGDVPVADEVRTSRPEVALDRSHALEVGYMISPAPAGTAGLSHAVALRYAYDLGLADVGLAAEVGYGASSAMGAQRLVRAAVMASSRLELSPVPGLGLGAEAQVGWQLLSGEVVIETTRLEGTEPRGLRAELGGVVRIAVSGAFGLTLRGGVALDGFYATEVSSTRFQPFGALALAFLP
jgi:hypothetical protein